MIQKKRIFFFSLSLFAYGTCAQNNLLLIDTANYDRHNYNCFLTLAEQAGFKADYKQWYEVKKSTMEPYRTIVIALDGSLYSAIIKDKADKDKERSPALDHIFSILNTVSQAINKVIFFLIPDSQTKEIRLFNKLFFNRLHATDTTDLQNTLDQFLRHILVSNANKSYRYHTALLPKKDESWWLKFVEQIKSYLRPSIPEIKKVQDERIIAATLPLYMGDIEYELQPLFPLALYLYNKKSNNHYIISTLSTFCFAEITECFIRNPVDPRLREKMFKELNEIMHELFAVASTNQLPVQKSQKPMPEKLQVAHELAIKENKQQKGDKPIICGWIDTEPYMIKPELIETLLQVPFNLLWVQLSPEFYLADAAAKIQDKELFLKRIETFSRLLSDASKKLQKPVPPLYAGLTLTGNLNKDTVKNAAHDMYEEKFDKIPSPLDFENFWKPELLDVIDRFMETWQSLSNGLAIAGIFLDFEMYHAQDQTGQFISSMDFSDYAWQLFANCDNDLDIKNMKTVNERVRYLLIHKKFSEYLICLKQEAKKIGLKIREHITNKYPPLALAAYNIFPPYHWFYQGIMAGLSTENKPLLLATFNNRFYNHAETLEKDSIWVRHMPVLLLSKLKNEQDFAIIDQLIPYHDGIWLNKFSRLAESRKRQDWQWDWGVETTPLETKVFVEYLTNYLKKYGIR